MIGLVTDSNGALPEGVVDRLPPLATLGVVPLHVTVDRVEYREGVDLDADGFYRLLAAEPTPAVGSSQPSPGAFLAAYRDQAEAGATEILSIHIGSELSGTLNAARAAAQRAPVPVRLLDSHTASFGVAFAVWAAAEALAAGATADLAEVRALDVVARLRNVFVVRALDLAAAGGRTPARDGRGRRCRSRRRRRPHPGAQSRRRRGRRRRPGRHRRAGGPGHGGRGPAPPGRGSGWPSASPTPAPRPCGKRSKRDLADDPAVEELVRYRIGPSVGAHLGPGTAAALFLPWIAAG